MRVVVTGGAGFIGSHLVEELLAKKYEVIVIDNFSTGKLSNLQEFSNKITVFNHDIRLPLPNNIFNGCSIVFHLAALADIVPSIEQPSNYLSTNIQGTVNVLEAARESRVERFVYTASSTCYGTTSKYPTSENDEIRPTFPYALSKYLAELVFSTGLIYMASKA